jgi:membrane protease YdiL (CAAX protease family)
VSGSTKSSNEDSRNQLLQSRVGPDDSLHWKNPTPPTRCSNRLRPRFAHPTLGIVVRWFEIFANMVVNGELIIFFVVAYVWAWAVYLPMVQFHAPLQWAILATMGPTIGAIVAHRVATGHFRAFRFLTGWLRVLGSVGIGVILIILAYVALPGITTSDPRTLHWDILASLTVYNYSTLLAGPLFEEPGWRGFALPRLEASFGPVRASLLLALLWTGWHLPLFFYPGWTTIPLWIYALIVTGVTVLMTYGTNLARFSVITPIVMHATFNTASRFLNGLLAGTEHRVHVPLELVLALCGLATAAVLIVATRGHLGYGSEGIDAIADQRLHV